MARASTRTILPLDTFAEIIGISPLHFNQIVVNEDGPNGRPIAPATVCDQVVTQRGWMVAGRIGREDIARAIREAEITFTDHLGYPPAPTWIQEERVELTPPANPSLYGIGLDIRGQWTTVKADNGYVIYGGREAFSLIDSSVPVVYTDSDGDGYAETATIVFTTTVTEEQELAVFYPNMGSDVSWEIRPLTNISIVSGTATVTFKREQAVIASLLESISPIAVDGIDDANFLTDVAVYRRYNDPSQMVRFLWNNLALDYGLFWPCGGCGDCNCNYCVQNTQWGCLTTKLPRQGIFSVSPATWDSVNERFQGAYWTSCRAPDSADLWYRAGWRNGSARWPMLQMDPEWARGVALLALTKLDRPMCGCEELNAFMEHWKDDLAATTTTPSGGVQTFKLSNYLLECPLGTTRAAIEAWQHIRRYQLGEAVRGA